MKYIYILLIIFFTVFQFDFSYGSLLISGDKKLSDNVSTETVSGDYSLTTGEINLVKNQTITSSNTAGKGSCQSVRQAVELIAQGVPTYGVWFVTGVASCIETDFNNDGNIEIVYALNKAYMSYQGYYQYSTVTYITKQPSDKLILSGNLNSRDYSLNEKELPGALIQQSIGGNPYYVTNISIGYRDYNGITLYFSVLGEIWGNKHVVDTSFGISNGPFSYDSIIRTYIQNNANVQITNSATVLRYLGSGYYYDPNTGGYVRTPNRAVYRNTVIVYVAGVNVYTTYVDTIGYTTNATINLYAIPEVKAALLASGKFTDTGSSLVVKSVFAPTYDYFLKLNSINKQSFTSIIINNKQYYTGSYPTYNISWDHKQGLKVDTYYLYDNNFNIVMTLGDSGEYAFSVQGIMSYPFTIYKSEDLNGYGDVISSKLGHSDWIIIINKGSLNLVDIKNKKTYNIILNVLNFGNGWYSTTDYINPSLVYADNNSILFQENTWSYAYGAYIGGLILLDQNITLDAVNNKVLQVQEKKASTYLPDRISSWQGIIKDTIYSNGRDLYQRERSTNGSSLVFLGLNNGGRHDCFYSTCDTYELITRVIGGYTVYDLQYLEWGLSNQSGRTADTHIFFTFRNSDGAYIGMKRTPGLTRATRLNRYQLRISSVFAEGTNLDNTSMIYRTLSTNSLQYTTPGGRVVTANPQTVFQYTPSTNYLSITN